MKFMEFNSEASGMIDEETIKKSNILLSTSGGRAKLMLALIKAINDIRVPPEALLEQLQTGVKENIKKEKDWGTRESQRMALRMLEIVFEIRKIMREMIPKIEVFENEKDEQEYIENKSK